MALMFPRLARNLAKNGYYPTDEATLERTLALLEPSNNGHMHIIDPCAGEGVALAEAAHHLGRDMYKPMPLSTTLNALCMQRIWLTTAFVVT